jgi:hypothetical protein
LTGRNSLLRKVQETALHLALELFMGRKIQIVVAALAEELPVDCMLVAKASRLYLI